MAIFLVFSLFSLNISFSFFLLFLKRRRRKKAFLFSSFEEEKEGEREMEERKCFCPFGEKRDLQGHLYDFNRPEIIRLQVGFIFEEFTQKQSLMHEIRFINLQTHLSIPMWSI